MLARMLQGRSASTLAFVLMLMEKVGAARVKSTN